MFLLYLNPDSIVASLVTANAKAMQKAKEENVRNLNEDTRTVNTKTPNTKQPAPAQSLVTAFLNKLNSNGFFSPEIAQNIKTVFENLLKTNIFTASQREIVQSAGILLSSRLPNLVGILVNVFRTPEFMNKLENRLSAYLKAKNSSGNSSALDLSKGSNKPV